MIFAFSAFLVFLAIGTPIVFVLGIAATLTLMLTQPDIPLTIVTQRIYDGLNSFTIMAIPFFVFAGAIMEAGGISRRIVDFASAMVGWIIGSLLMVSVVAATGLAAISGSGSADVAAISAIMQPELRRRKYDVDFSAAIIACAGSLAQIIPPSLMMVVVALVSNLSVGAMFLAGVLPGLLTVPGLLASAYLHARHPTATAAATKTASTSGNSAPAGSKPSASASSASSRVRWSSSRRKRFRSSSRWAR